MKRIVFATAGLALAGLVQIAHTTHGWAQTNEPGPGEGGAVLKDPHAPAAPALPASSPYLDTLLKQAPTGQPNPNPANRSLPPYEEKPDINHDLQVTKELGPWMIMVHAYTGPEAAIMARQMVTELRAAYKLPAYTFNYGAEERRKEYERKKAIFENHMEFLAKNGLPQDQPFTVRTVRINEQVGVLIGGYSSAEAARRTLVDSIHKLKPLDPNKVLLDKRVFYAEEPKKGATKAEKLQEGYVNPFLGATVAHNPTIKQERPADWDKLDIGQLRKLNAGESFSLLNNKKKITLVVKVFETPTMLQPKEDAGSFLENFGLGSKAGQRVDAAAISAHNLAEYLNKAKLDAYVLHTKYCSIVCVGGYDIAEDPGLKNMANLIETKVLPNISQYLYTTPNQAAAQARVMPMKIPR